jgi:hypothetical protein
MPKLRVLTGLGLASFGEYLSRLKDDPHGVPPVDLLQDSEASAPLGADVSVDEIEFSTKLEASRYLRERLEGVDRELVDQNRGLWGWLSLLYFDQLIRRSTDGTRTPGDSARYLPSEDRRREYRHLLQGPYKLYVLHGEKARLLLNKPLHVWSDLEEQLVGIQEVIRMPGAMGAADLLYYDPARNEAKKGTTNRRKQGTVRRFGAIVQQLDLTYDLYSMSGQELLNLLPREFDRFRP